MASPSTTQPQNAVYDGQSYYYMPWRDVKPCVMLISHWEDNTFRIESLNFLLNIINNLVSVVISEDEFNSVEWNLNNKFLVVTKSAIIHLENNGQNKIKI